ncbi:hypothetical protein D9613_011979 [Agrocybe pediades]|uniref:Uncharacterized protein n=1 Tax=Agrocybe pediades TaxID=84607 RepID=A0A8H4QFJ0_9AGAR|nr:hypothetical protein D9613_011979 [Agrocybe pediades]
MRGGANGKLSFSQYNYHGQASLESKAPIVILTDAVAQSHFTTPERASIHQNAIHDTPKDSGEDRIAGKAEEAHGKLFMSLSRAAGCRKPAIAQSIVVLCLKTRPVTR